MLAENLILKLNKIESWLQSPNKSLKEFPKQAILYIVLTFALMLSSFFAIIRWPIISIGRLFSPRADSSSIDFDRNCPIDVDQELLEKVLKKNEFVLLDFWAEWCGPCVMMNGSIKKLAETHGEKYVIAKANTMLHPQIAQESDVRGIPTLLLFQNGIEIKRNVGALSHSELVEFINPPNVS